MKRKLQMLGLLTVVCIVAVMSSHHFTRTSGSAAQTRTVQLPASLKAAILVGRWHDIDTEAAQWGTKDGDSPAASILRGYAASVDGRSTDAAAFFVRADLGARSVPARGFANYLATDHPESAIAQLLAGDELARGGDLAAALSHLNEAVALNHGLDIARLARAVVELKMGDSKGANEDLASIPANSPVANDSLLVCSIVQIQQGENAKAADCLDHVLESSPDNALAHNIRGVALAHAGDWQDAADDFTAAFRTMPDLTAARHNWQLAQRASSDLGTVIASQLQHGTITIVSANDPKDLFNATALATEQMRLRTGQAPIVVQSVTDAVAKARTQNVVLPLSTSGLASAAGDRTLQTLQQINGRTPVNFLTIGNEAADRTSTGVLRYMNTAPVSNITRVQSIQSFDPSDVAGLAGKTPLAGVQDLGTIASRLEQVASRGVNVAVFPVEGKLGLQHLGNVSAFENRPGVDVITTPWKGSLQTSLGLSTDGLDVGIGMEHAADKASARTDLSPRDWTLLRGTTFQPLMGTAADIGKNYLKFGDSAMPAAPIRPIQPAPGGVTLGPVNIARQSGGKVTFASGPDRGQSLILVYPIFGVADDTR